VTDYVEDGDENILKPGDSPTLYTSLSFVDGFYQYLFNDMYTFLKQYNPVFGEGTHGYCSRWMVEFCYVVHTRLKK
jgi:hypothetical protein